MNQFNLVLSFCGVFLFSLAGLRIMVIQRLPYGLRAILTVIFMAVLMFACASIAMNYGR